MAQPVPVPRLTVTNGRLRGVSFHIPPGHSTIGRADGLGIVIDDSGVSRQHVAVDRTGTEVVLIDLGSTNGTQINYRPLQGLRQLQDGDLVMLGSLELQFAGEAAQAAPPVVAPPGARSYAFGGVDGPVHAGNGDQYLAGRDLYADHSVQVSNDYDPSDDVFQGQGAGRFLAVLGYLVAVGGFFLFAYAIFSPFVSGGFGPGGPDPFELFNPPLAAAGFAGAILGGVMAAVGIGMSKTARRRAGYGPRRHRY